MYVPLLVERWVCAAVEKGQAEKDSGKRTDTVGSTGKPAGRGPILVV